MTGLIDQTADNPNTIGQNFRCRAWANFSDSDHVIRASGNISSITNNTEYCTVNFTSNMPDTNYAIVGCSGDSGTASGCWLTTGYNVASVNTSNTTSSFRTQIYYTTSSTTSSNAYIYVAVFR